MQGCAAVIGSFRSRALRQYWLRADPRQLPPQDVERINVVLQLLDDATAPQDVDAHGLHFHALTGNMRERYAVTIRANWRITFACDGTDAVDVDYEDYH